MLLLDPSEEQSWEALRDLMVEDLSVTVHLTLTEQMIPTMPDLLDRLVKMDVKLLSSAKNNALRNSMIAVRHQAAEKGLSLIWDIPVPYSSFNPIAAELAEGEEVKGAGRAWLYVEPDGDVLPAQGLNQVLGNMLVDPWEAIWSKHP
jgi:MoaA/NifB/PqqE/SkfB family radical SAM enzyme